MSTDEKFIRELESLERQFRDRLLKLLPEAVKTGSWVFTNTTFNPHNLLTHSFRTDADELFEDAEACLRLREKLSLPASGSVGELFIAACREGADLESPHRRGPRRLADALLKSLSAMS